MKHKESTSSTEKISRVVRQSKCQFEGCYLTFQGYYTIFTVDNTRREGISVKPWKKRISVAFNEKMFKSNCLSLPQGLSHHRGKQSSIFIYEVFNTCQQEEPGKLSDQDVNLTPKKLMHFIKLL